MTKIITTIHILTNMVTISEPTIELTKQKNRQKINFAFLNRQLTEKEC